MTFPPLLRRWKNDIFYDNTKPDIVISVIFTQNEDLVVLKYRIKSGGRLFGSKYFGGKRFSSPANFPRHYKAAPTLRVFSRRHAATVTLQCKTELDIHSPLLVMHFSHLLFEITLVNQNSHVTHVP